MADVNSWNEAAVEVRWTIERAIDTCFIDPPKNEASTHPWFDMTRTNEPFSERKGVSRRLQTIDHTALTSGPRTVMTGPFQFVRGIL